MNWLNLRTAHLRGPEFVGSSPMERGVWLCVLCYCAEVENGGRISDAASWKTRQWQQACGVTRNEIDKTTRLLSWNGEDLIVWNYPNEKEKEVISKRNIAVENGKKGGRPLKNGSNHEPMLETEEKPTSVILENQRPKAEGERKEKEKEKGKEEEPPLPQTAPPSGSKEDVYPDSDFSIRISKLFNKRITTRWSDKEIKSFKALMRREAITHEALDTIEEYYDSERQKCETGIHRRDLQTFLNNFDGELDRATNATPPKPAQPEIADFVSPYAEGYAERTRAKWSALLSAPLPPKE